MEDQTIILTPNQWILDEIDAHLKSLEIVESIDPAKLEDARKIHRIMQQHYSTNGTLVP
jgi:hypothetical protein